LLYYNISPEITSNIGTKHAFFLDIIILYTIYLTFIHIITTYNNNNTNYISRWPGTMQQKRSPLYYNNIMLSCIIYVQFTQ